MIVVVDLNAVAPAGNAARRFADDSDRLNDVVDENRVGKNDQCDTHGADRRSDQRVDQDAVIRLPQRRHIAQNADHTGVEHDRAGNGEDLLSRLRIPALEVIHRSADRCFNIRRRRRGSGGESVGGDLYATVGVDELQLDAVLFLERLGGIGRETVVFAVALDAVTCKGVRRRAGARFKPRAHVAIVILCGAEDINNDGKRHQRKNRKHCVDQPALSQAADMQTARKTVHALRHIPVPPSMYVHAPLSLRHSTYSRIPTR